MNFFLEESSIHSFNFIGKAKTLVERASWTLVFGLSMTGGFLMIRQLYQKMDLTAIDILIDDRLMDVSEIPFPAVTIFGKLQSPYDLATPVLEEPDIAK